MTDLHKAPLLTPATIGLLLLPPLVWAGNAVLGHVVADMVPPITLNFFRWVLASLLLLPWAWRVLLPSSALWAHWQRYAVLSLLGVGCYNSFQYLALHTSTPINVTLVGSSVPVFMLAIGAIWFKQQITEAGFDSYLYKPVNMNDLREQLEKITSNRRIQVLS
jgi:drug/metabolite transporter (DMT)-like permease